MKDVKRYMLDELPSKFINLGTGYWYYNYDIKKEEQGYSYIQARISGTPTYSECVKQVIRLYLSQEEEFDIINSANTYVLGMTDDKSVITQYISYLELVQQIKEYIKKDFKR